MNSFRTFEDPLSKFVDVSLGICLENDPRACQPGDAIMYEEEGVVYTLLEELMRDDTYVTWRALITAHDDDDKLGAEEWVGIDLTRPLLDGGRIIRGS